MANSERSRRHSLSSSRDSLEEIIIELYKKSLEQDHEKKKKKPKRPTSASPYQKKVAPESMSTLNKSRRPMSAKPSSRRRLNSLNISAPSRFSQQAHSEVKADDDHSSSFTSDSDDQSDQENKSKVDEVRNPHKISMRKRSKSAQAGTRKDSIPLSPSQDLSRPLYKRQPYTIMCMAYKNGSLEGSTKLTAPSIKQLLESATLKLGINTAARRLFLADGSEVFRPRDIPRDADIFVSKGEAFKDPYRGLKDMEASQQEIYPTVKQNRGTRKKVKAPGLKRLNELVGKHTKRVVVFVNGTNKESNEVVLNPQAGMVSFLDACTARLRFNASVRAVYDWKGNSITQAEQIEKIDHTMFKTPSVSFGPLWVSKGESFNPSGALGYVEEVISLTRLQLQSAKHCKNELGLMLEERFGEVTSQEILELEAWAVQPTLDKVNEDVEEIRSLLQKYKSRRKTLKGMTTKEESEYECDDRMVGLPGIKVRIHENGVEGNPQEVHVNMRDVMRGAQGDKQLIRARFLEVLTSWHKPTDPSGPARSVTVRRIFDEDGNEIEDVGKIENEQRIWLSYGEDFKPHFTPALTFKIEKVAAVTDDSEEGGETIRVYREMLDVANDMPQGAERSNQWEVSDGFPAFYDSLPLSQLHPARKYEVEKSIKFQSFPSDDHYLAHKSDRKLVLHPELEVDRKSSSRGELWPREAQTFIFNQNGQIYSRAFPGLALSLDNNRPITVHLTDGTMLEGSKVSLRRRIKGDSSQEWGFTQSGNIHAISRSEQVLTFLDEKLVQKIVDLSKQGDSTDPDSVSNLSPARPNPDQPSCDLSVVALERAVKRNRLVTCQRWAIKQESLVTPNQWKHTKVENRCWRKLALSWPVLPDGNWNKDYYWPLEGALLCKVPPPNKQDRKESGGEDVVKLKVARNGESGKRGFVHLVAPDLSHMQKKDPRIGGFPRSGRRRRQKVDEAEIEKTKKQIEDLEMNLFLERATSLLDLGFAARRLFDDSGKELHTLRGLVRHQVVYVSSGEGWVDPRTTKSDHKRRQMLARLHNDVTMIRAFCALRNPQDLVLDLSNGPNPGSKIVLKQIIKQEKKDVTKGASRKRVTDDISSENSTDESIPLVSNTRSAHEKSHLQSDLSFNAKKYPWQRNNDEDLNDDKITEAEPMNSARSSKSLGKDRKQKQVSNQRFVFTDGFISPSANQSLALGVTGLDLDKISGIVEVELCKKSLDDPVQQWVLTEDGFIRLRCNPRFGLGVSPPPFKPGTDQEVTFEGCYVTIQQIRQESEGRSHQKWFWDPTSDQIHAFHSHTTDKEVTAANHISICTCAVAGAQTLNQEGYLVLSPGNNCPDPILVCCSCAKVMRGITQLEKAPTNWSFACAMGNPRKYGLKQRGSFAFLNGKVDLSTFEADSTLSHWSMQLDKLHHVTSLRSINREINTSVPNQACRVLAMRNGQGRLKAPELIIGTSVSGILEQCTHRLSLGNAARRLYTCDGMQILHMEQLVQWAVNNFNQQQAQSLWASGDKDAVYGRGEPEGHSPKKNDDNAHSTEGTPDHEDPQLVTRMRPPSGRKPPTSSPSGGKSPDMQGLPDEIPLAVVLRHPVEVWVSCGENFVPPGVAEHLVSQRVGEQMGRNVDNLVVDTEKHVIRHMQGRRFKEMSPHELKPTKSPQQPILIQGGWQETTKSEASKIDLVHRLEEHLSEQRPSHPIQKTKGIDFNRELYRQPVKKRVMVYQKGESANKAAYVWGESIGEILSDATVRLNMAKRARSLYDQDGAKITSFDGIERDSLLCVTSGESLKGRPKQSDMQMKANYAKVRKQKGPESANVPVTSHDLTTVGVDPYGPPGLTSNPFSNLEITSEQNQTAVAWNVE